MCYTPRGSGSCLTFKYSAAAAEPSYVSWRPHIPNRLLQAIGLLMGTKDRYS